LCSGFLTGKFTAGDHSNTRFGDEHPLGKAMQGIFGTQELHLAVGTLAEATKKFDMPLHEAALRWICHHSALNENDGVIPGATKLQQLEENMKTISRGSLPNELVKVFDECWQTLEPKRGSIV
jgi:aflatoxin B1 aldehyde reductase